MYVVQVVLTLGERPTADRVRPYRKCLLYFSHDCWLHVFCFSRIIAVFGLNLSCDLTKQTRLSIFQGVGEGRVQLVTDVRMKRDQERDDGPVLRIFLYLLRKFLVGIVCMLASCW
jgi:hypothetical protein